MKKHNKLLVKRAFLYLTALLLAFPLDVSVAQGQIKSLDMFAKDKVADAVKEVPKTEALPAQDAPKVEGLKRQGPIFCIAVRSELRDKYRGQGMGRLEAIRKARHADDEIISELVPDAEKIASGKMNAQVKVGALGDGKILEAIIEFFKSPQGQAILDALVKLLLGLLLVFEHYDNPMMTIFVIDYLLVSCKTYIQIC